MYLQTLIFLELKVCNLFHFAISLSKYLLHSEFVNSSFRNNITVVLVAEVKGATVFHLVDVTCITCHKVES